MRFKEVHRIIRNLFKNLNVVLFTLGIKARRRSVYFITYYALGSPIHHHDIENVQRDLVSDGVSIKTCLPT